MRRYRRYILAIPLLIIVVSIIGNSDASVNMGKAVRWNDNGPVKEEGDTLAVDTIGKLPYPFRDKGPFGNAGQQDSSALYLHDPSNMKKEVEYDPETGDYIFYDRIGDFNYRLPRTMSLEEYRHWDFQESIKRYWRQRMAQQSFEQQSQLIPQLKVGGESFNRIFGSNTVSIRPQGYVELSLGVQTNRIDNPSIPERMRKTTTFDFNEKVNMNVVGQIGSKLNMRVNYNTEATFDFENKMKLNYTGDEDEIVKNVEAGNVSMPLSGSLITGGTNLFGVRTDLQFGKLAVSTIFSQQKGETKTIETEGGAQKTKFKLDVTDYDANRHFFLGQYFYDHYDQALANLPVINSAITINKVEVWVTNKSNDFKESRNILALTDLGERGANRENQSISEFGDTPGLSYPENVYTFNGANQMYKSITSTYSGIRNIAQLTQVMAPLASRGFVAGRDYEKIENARRLSPSEYTVNKKLGYISLNSALNADEVLAVAYQYTANGKTYQVGEFSTDGIDAPQTLVLKLIKGTDLNPKFKNWDLMMKNVYNLGAYQLSPEDFRFDVEYQNDSTGTNLNYLPTGPLKEKILLKVMNLDNLNKQKDPYPDGLFDFIDGVTIDAATGRVFFPVVQPFGSNLKKQLGSDQTAIDRYVFQSLYDETKTVAEQDAEKNKYQLVGSYKGSASNEISLNTINVARGSVKVTAGGRELTENVDYVLDYAQGTVKIINQGLLESGTPISVSTESNNLFSMQRKTLLGTHMNYEFNKNFNLGGTVMYLHEKPLTQKVNYGEDPISNTMLGLNASYKTSSQLITNLVDALPFLDTKAESKVAVDAEFAQLLPGHSKVISNAGAVYIDDFEGTKTTIDMKTQHAWTFASTPQGQDMFPEGELVDNLANGYNRAKLAWYVIDPLLQRNTATTPKHLLEFPKQRSSNYVREVYQSEIYPDRQTPVGQPTNIPTLDLAYYPSEKGPYNFDTYPSTYSAGVAPNGSLNQPETRWGGIMRQVQTSDFEAANIEYIEFWMMDPFAEDTLQQNPGGDLYFDLGNVSEDILRDGRKSFENGLPADGNYAATCDTTAWGRVSRQQSLVKAFDNNPQARRYQDVGLDGLDSKDEESFYKTYLDQLKGLLIDSVYAKVYADPANDNFHYFRGTDYDNEKLGILQRYKNYNNPDGNSPTSDMSPEPYSTAATSIPDAEDINDDNTLSENESYFQYHLKLDRQDLTVGKNYITDAKTARVKLKDGTTSEITWYQFKIPVKQPTSTIGTISDFRSIRFMRMFLRGWKKPVVLRFATLDLVRSDWRIYEKDLSENNSVPSPNTKFEISAVNIEENANREPVNYVLPPGISRVIDPANPQIRQLNEQSMVLRTIDLPTGDARAAYKTTTVDMRRYKTLKMEVHAEAIKNHALNDDDLSLFIRIGSDYRYNYYEYEIPLKLTPPGYYSNDSQNDRFIVWPEANRMYIPLDLLPKLKLERNAKMRQAGSQLSMNDVFEKIQNGVNNNQNIIKVKGNPNLGEVTSVMIGIRNKDGSPHPGSKSVEVWVNELRLTDFDEKGGWAALGRISGNLADLGTYSFAGRTSTAGFGSIDSKMQQRSMEDSHEYDISTNLQLGKFFGEKSGVQIPMYLGFSKAVQTPEYSPLDPDVKLKDALDAAANKSERDSIKRISQDYTTRRSINFTNVHIDKPNKKGKPKVYDISNFAVTYSFNQYYHRDINTTRNETRNTRMLFSYNYNTRPKAVEPFKNVKLFRSPWFSLIRDFNFYYSPEQISFRSDMNRRYSELQYRNITNPDFIIPSSYEKDFIWDRYYDLRYSLTRSLKLDVSAQNTSRVEEPLGVRLNKNQDEYEARRDTIIQSILDGGRNTHYHHTVNASYTLPINKIPLLNWTSGSARYQSTFDWDTGPITSSEYQLGNIIQNSRSMQFNGQANLVNLYNKVPFLRKVNQKYSGGRGRRSMMRRPSPMRSDARNGGNGKEVRFADKGLNLKAGKARSIFHKLGTKDVRVTVTDAKGKPINGEVKIVNENRVTFTAPRDYTNANVLVVGTQKPSANIALEIAQFTSRLLMMVRDINISYTQTDGTVLPGYLPNTSYFGLENYAPDGSTVKSLAPGWPFVLGQQDPDFAWKAIQNGWMTTDSAQNSPYQMTHNNTLNLRAKLEPIPGLKIDLTANRSYSENSSEFYLYDAQDGWGAYNKNYFGNFTMSVITIGSAFDKLGTSGVQQSSAWDKFRDYRHIIAGRLAAQRVANPNQGYDPGKTDPTTGFPDGYGPTAAQVLIPSFFAAYTGTDPNKVSLDPFPSVKFMMPNWRLQYNGAVNAVPGLKNIMKTVSISHAYRSSYNVGSFISNLNYDELGDGFSYVRDYQDNFLPKNDINAISINESFSPLFNVDVTWLNNLTTRFEYRKSRNLTLSLTNNQLTEVYNNEMSVGLGYRFEDLKLFIKTKNSQKTLNNDLQVRADFGLRKNKTVLRKLVESDDQLTAGQQAMTIKLSADYNLSEAFIVRLYYDRIVNNPFISLSYPTANSNIGVSFRFTLSH
ncbi:cell surface protein SprA [Prolixibacter denitrificans]|uniref:T9SS outer membrane translocon Sov/SprA n=1 Tax=Prolixibacter denitrificans TaxID=1541063 RepID=UPI0011B1FB50|nr:cell surface protein SprA [Prolixibacter denitrificans]